MEVLSLTVVLATIFAWCVLAARLERHGLTAPIVFVAAGFVFVAPGNGGMEATSRCACGRAV